MVINCTIFLQKKLLDMWQFQNYQLFQWTLFEMKVDWSILLITYWRSFSVSYDRHTVLYRPVLYRQYIIYQYLSFASILEIFVYICFSCLIPIILTAAHYFLDQIIVKINSLVSITASVHWQTVHVINTNYVSNVFLRDLFPCKAWQSLKKKNWSRMSTSMVSTTTQLVW